MLPVNYQALPVQEFDSNGLYIGSYDATRSEKIKANVSDLDHIDSEIQRYLSEYAEDDEIYN